MSRYIAMVGIERYKNNDVMYIIDRVEHKIVKGSRAEIRSKITEKSLYVSNLCVINSKLNAQVLDEEISERVVINGNVYNAKIDGLYIDTSNVSREDIRIELEEDMKVIIDQNFAGRNIYIKNTTVCIREGAVIDNIVLEECRIISIRGKVTSLNMIGGCTGRCNDKLGKTGKILGEVGLLRVERARIAKGNVIGRLQIKELEVIDADVCKSYVTIGGCRIWKAKISGEKETDGFRIQDCSIGNLYIGENTKVFPVYCAFESVYASDKSWIGTIGTKIDYIEVNNISSCVSNLKGDVTENYECIVDYNTSGRDNNVKLKGFRVIKVDSLEKVDQIIKRLETLGTDKKEKMLVIMSKGKKKNVKIRSNDKIGQLYDQ